MIFVQIVILYILAYLIARTLTTQLRNENEKLQAQLIVVKTKQQEERELYKDRVNQLNDSLDSYAKR